MRWHDAPPTWAQAAELPPCTPEGMLRMEKFIERQNIVHYVDQLKAETDPTKRAMLLRLLAEEKAKQASHGTVKEWASGRPTENPLVEDTPKPD